MTEAPPFQRRTLAWDPGQYLKFADLRFRPAMELIQRIPLESANIIVDLGCGTGEITQVLADRWPSAGVTGIDRSNDMLEKARSMPGPVRWIQQDIATWTPERPPDLIFSNAALHWLEGHRELFPRLAGFLKPGGCLAVQMPLSWELPSHRLMRKTLEDGKGGSPFGSQKFRRSVSRRPVARAREYYKLLAGVARHIDIWTAEYLQLLETQDAVYEWVSGTGLRPVLQGLDEDERSVFIDEYKRRLRQAYPTLADGSTIYPFRRLFIVAQVDPSYGQPA